MRKLLWIDLGRRLMYMATAIIIIVVATVVGGQIVETSPHPTLGHYVMMAAIIVVGVWWSIKFQIAAWAKLDLVDFHKELRKVRQGKELGRIAHNAHNGK